METADNLPSCPVCGGTAFTWGVARGGSGHSLDFVPGLSLWQQLKSLTVSATRLEARACDQCGNVVLFLKGCGRE